MHPDDDELERRLRARLDALGPAPRAELLHVLMLPDLERAGMIGESLEMPGESRAFTEPDPRASAVTRCMRRG